jgi:PEP-CTERM motif-containing protein
MNAHLTRFGRAAACATVLLLAPSAGQAAMLLPGTTLSLSAADILAAPAGTLLDSVVQPLVTDFYTGTLSAAVLRNAGGTLDFYYQVTNDAGSLDPIARETNTTFRSIAPPQIFTTEALYRTDDAGLPALFSAGDATAAPLSADRTSNARVVGFGFVTPAVLEGIDPGETSMILVVRTNATLFTGGVSSVIDGTTSTVRTFSPRATDVSTVPEPASLLLLSSAFGAAGYMARHRARRKKPGGARSDHA